MDSTSAYTRFDLGGGRVAIRFQSYSVLVEVQLETPVNPEQLIPYLPPSLATESSEKPDCFYRIENLGMNLSDTELAFRLWRGERCLLERGSVTEGMALFEDDLALLLATDERHELTFIHAGVVGINDRVVVIPGTSRSGKSTLVTALIAAGATYFSDEFAVINQGGMIEPYPRQLSLRGEDLDAPGTKISPASLGAKVASSAARLGAVIATRFECRGNWAGDRLTAGQGALLMMENAVAAQLAPQRTLKAITASLREAVVWQGVRGEASEAVPAIERLLAEKDRVGNGPLREVEQ